MKEKELNNIIVVEQLPIIKEKLQIISDEVDKEIEYALSLECNEENKNVVKKARSDINKIKTELEDKRKMVKEQILEPYYQFEDIYNELIKNKLFNADETLKYRINEIEYTQKLAKENELRAFVEQHCKANNVDIPFEKIGLNITLSASEKSLKDKAKDFIEKVANDIKLINMESEYSDEILLEYKNNYDYVDAKTKVIERHKQLQEIHMKVEEVSKQEQADEKVIEKVEEAIEITAPIEIDEDKQKFQFEVSATKTQIKKLIEFMKELGVEYK